MALRRRIAIAAALVALMSALLPAVAAAASPTIFTIARTTSGFEARSDTGIVYTGTLKQVVEAAARDLDAVGGGRVQFGSGTYDLGTSFFLLHDLANVEFAGAGITSTVIRNNTSVAADTEPFNMRSVTGLIIRDMTVVAEGAYRSTSDALDFDNGNRNEVLRVRITAARGRAIVFDGKEAGWSATGNVVRDCVIDGVPADGIQLLAASGNTISGCTIRNVGRHGIQIVKASPTAPTPNEPSNDNVIENNTIDESGADGINVTSGNRNRIRGNRVTNSSDVVLSRDGIRITSTDSTACNDNIVEGNTATDTQATKTQRYGLLIASSLCARTVVNANRFGGNRVGAVRDVGTGTIYLSDSQPPTTPTGLTATAVSTSRVDLSWNAASDNVGVTGYTVYRNGTAIATTGASTRTFSNTGLTADTEYRYQVDAFDLAGFHSTKSTAAIARTFPVTTGVAARIVADTWVGSDAPTTSHATSTSLRVDSSPARRAYFRFDVQGLSAAPRRVLLRVYSTSGSAVGHDVRPVASDTWSERITWETRPAVGSVARSSGPFAAGWVQVDVTALVTGNGPHSFALTTPSSTGIGYASRESANDPQLVITP